MTMIKRSLWKAMMTAAAVITIEAPSQADANIVGAYVDLVNSYRQDKIFAHLNTYDGYHNLIEENHINMKNISLYQIGAKGQVVACNLFARGEAYWGWSDNGNYRESSNIWNGYPSKSKARLHHGRTRDFTVGGGYYLPTCGLFNLGPSGGWSYHSQEFTVHRARIQGYTDDLLNGLQFHNTWQGPWAGVDAQIEFCGFELRGGYSYHWANWQGKWHLKAKGYDWQGNENLGFSEKCKCSDVRGQEAYIDVLWSLCPCVELGLGFKWQRWEGKNGKQKHRKINCMPCYETQMAVWRETDKVKNVTWESFTVSLDLGIVF